MGWELKVDRVVISNWDCENEFRMATVNVLLQHCLEMSPLIVGRSGTSAIACTFFVAPLADLHLWWPVGELLTIFCWQFKFTFAFVFITASFFSNLNVDIQNKFLTIIYSRLAQSHFQFQFSIPNSSLKFRISTFNAQNSSLNLRRSISIQQAAWKCNDKKEKNQLKICRVPAWPASVITRSSSEEESEIHPQSEFNF